MGVGERFGLLDIGRGRTYWFATKNAPEGEREQPRGRKAEVMRHFSGWHETVAAVIEATDERAILRNDVYYPEPLPRGSDGRFVLVGDAAHATTRAWGRAPRWRSRMASSSPIGPQATMTSDPRSPSSDPSASGRGLLKMSRRANKAAQVASPLGWRLRNVIVRRLPERAQRRQLEPLVRYEH